MLGLNRVEIQGNDAEQFRIQDILYQNATPIKLDCYVNEIALQPGDYVTVYVIFKPTSQGTKNAQLVVYSSYDSGEENVNLTGTGQ